MKKIALALLGAALVMPSVASAEKGDILARFRIANVSPDVSSSVDGLDVKDDTIPEVDFTYFITKNIATELILGTSHHEVTLNGASLGKVSVLPPTLTAQYHFMPDASVRPYAGIGVNYTMFYNSGLANDAISIKNSSFGMAYQAGVDFQVAKNGFINLDVKKIDIKTDVYLNASNTTLTTLKINPYVFGIGYGMKF